MVKKTLKLKTSKEVPMSNLMKKMQAKQNMRSTARGMGTPMWEMTSKGMKCPTCGKTAY